MRYKPTTGGIVTPPKRNFWQELLTFPGYGAILLSWTGLLGVLLYVAIVVIGSPANGVIVLTPATNQASSTGQVSTFVAILLFIGLIGLSIYALWLYVADWTRRVLQWLQQKLGISQKYYWLFCMAVLTTGWLIDTVAMLFIGDPTSEFVVALLAAIAIFVGSISFWLAALAEQKHSKPQLHKKLR